MKAHFCARRTFSTFDAHFKGSFTADAKFEFALGACEMHTTTFGESVSKFATGALNSVFLQMFLNPFGLIIGVVGFFPSRKIFA